MFKFVGKQGGSKLKRQGRRGTDKEAASFSQTLSLSLLLSSRTTARLRAAAGLRTVRINGLGRFGALGCWPLQVALAKRCQDYLGGG